MSHENARAFGAIMTTLWPLGVSDAETGLINLATKVTHPGDAVSLRADHLTGALDFILVRGMPHSGMLARLHSWRAACLVAGALTPDIELRLDVLSYHMKELE